MVGFIVKRITKSSRNNNSFTSSKLLNSGQISIKEITLTYNQSGKSFVALDNFSLEIMSGEFVCLIGPSGCGKSSVLNCIGGFLRPSFGSVKMNDQLITKPGSDLGMVFQQPYLFPWKTVLQNIAHGPLMKGKSKKEAHNIARVFLKLVGLSKTSSFYPSSLSGGMQQRVAIARALANAPNVLLMDEPFGALDAQTRFMMQENLMKLWHDLKTTVVFVTHDIDEAIFLADRVIIMSSNPGRIIKDLKVSLQRPRSIKSMLEPEFVSLKNQCFDLIRQQSLLAFNEKF